MYCFLRTLLVSVGVLCLSYAYSQETTATLRGLVSDSKGIPVSGASVLVKLEATGFSTGVQTNSKGVFVIPNLRPGGPYTITITFVGFQEEKMDEVNLILGSNPDLNVAMKSSDKNLAEVVVTGTNRRTGVGGLNVNRAQLATLPSIGRSLGDFTRLTPQSNNNSFAGTNFRYNNFTLDGAVNNDAIGFSNSFGGVSGGGQAGTAGSGTRTNPYSIETIQEVQVQLAPYDVKIGNFTGGSVNAVTKSGTNDFHGSAYFYGRNQAFVGKSVDGLKKSIGSDFYDYQTGATIGGPIMRNKAFFFINGEMTRRQEPTFYNVGDPGAAISLTEAQKITTFLQGKGYNPGSYGPAKIFTNSDKIFARLDFNLDHNNTLMLRALYTNGYGDNIERTSTNFQFTSTDFTQHTKNLNMVAELKSKWSNTTSNQLIISYINVHEYRDFPAPLSPFMDIDNGRIWLGTWRESSVYNMHQKTFEFSDNVTLVKGIHKFTFGTHNEFYDLTYGFINSWNGRWEYAGGVDSFLASHPTRIRGAFPFDASHNSRDQLYANVPNSEYKVNLLSAYAQDEISFSKRVRITPGIRVDYPYLPNPFPVDPTINSVVEYKSPNPTYSHTPFSELNNKWLGQATLSPRLGFFFDLKGDQSVVLRGGTGIFVGRMPFAWLGYASTLTGTTLGTIDYKPNATTRVPLALDPTTLKDTVTKYGGAGATNTREVDMVDNNFKLPTIWRSNIALDLKFGRGYKLTLDAMYTKTIWDVKFQQINIKDSVQYYGTGPNATPYYVGGKLSSAYSNVYFLTNTKEGYRYNLTAQISKSGTPMRMGGNHTFMLNWMFAYTYGMSKDVSNGIRNSFQSNFEVNPAITPSSSPLAFSNFDLRHRIIATIGGTLKWNDYNATSLTFFYSGQSGSPYSLIYTSAPFGNASNAPIPYIPKTSGDINLKDYKLGDGSTYTAAQQWTDLDNFIAGDKYLSKHRGEYAERNGLRTPWNHDLDMKLLHEFHFAGKNKQHGLALSFDVFNVLNLISNSMGHITFVTNVNNYTVNFLRFATDNNGKAVGSPASGYLPTFNYLPPPSGQTHYYTNDPVNSRWQGQLGLKYTF